MIYFILKKQPKSGKIRIPLKSYYLSLIIVINLQLHFFVSKSTFESSVN